MAIITSVASGRDIALTAVCLFVHLFVMDFHEIWGMGQLCSTEDLIKFWQIWGLGLVHLLLDGSDNLPEVCTPRCPQHIVKGRLHNCDAELSMRSCVSRPVQTCFYHLR